MVKESSKTDFRGQSYKHRRFFDRKVIFMDTTCSQVARLFFRAAFPSIPSLCGARRGDCSAFQQRFSTLFKAV